MSSPLIIGHRGHGQGPENTIQTFSEAVSLGAEMIELDVWLSADGVPVVYHDEFITSKGEKMGRVAQYSVAALREFDLPKGAQIPMLAEVLSEILPQVPLNIELKFYHLNYRPLVRAVLEQLRKAEAEEKVLLSSFFHQALEVVSWEEPRVATAPIFGVPTGPPHQQDLEKLANLNLQPNKLALGRPTAVVDYLMLSPDLVDRFKSAGLGIVAYTVDQSEDMEKMIALGVDGIITKNPSLLRRLTKNS